MSKIRRNANVEGSSRERNLPLIAGSSLAGTAMEWYDFFLYGTAAALVFPKLFFPSFDPLIGTLLAFSTYAVGFVARPIGAAILGNLGDNKGRKKTLILSLAMMGVATFCIGLLPTYGSIGVAAPLLLLLLRLVQGFALGGEWGGATLFAAEHSGRSNRAFWTAWPSMGAPLGNLMAAGVLAVLNYALPGDQFFSWGWRIAFLLSAILVVIGLFLRKHVTETPLFQQMDRSRPSSVSKQPAVLAMKNHWRAIGLAAIARFGDNSSFYIFSVFIITYTTKIRDFGSGNTLSSVTIGMAICTLAIPLFAILADRIGRKPILVIASAVVMVWPFAFFALVDTATFSGILIAVVIGLLIHSMNNAVLGPIYSEMFPTEVRYSAVSIAYNTASVFAGSLAPIIAIALYSHFQSAISIAIYIACMGLLSLLASLAVRETRGVDLATVRTNDDFKIDSASEREAVARE
jgi:metabolite-proton symporter